MSDTLPWHAAGNVRWLPLSRSVGRPVSPSAPSYSPTAVFVLGGEAEIIPGWPSTGEHFSLEIELGNPDLTGRVPARFRFLAPELVGDYLTPGAAFMVMEGPRPVGEAEVITVAGAADEKGTQPYRVATSRAAQEGSQPSGVPHPGASATAGESDGR